MDKRTEAWTLKAAELQSRGNQLHQNGDVDGARLHYIGAMYMVPWDSTPVGNLCAMLYKQRHFEAAIAAGRRALALNPKDMSAKMNLANGLASTGRISEALLHCRDVLKEHPKFGPGWFNYGQILYRDNRFPEAQAAFAKAIGLGFANLDVANDYGMSLLAQGEIDRGLQAWEVRWESLLKYPVWDSGIPEWKGEDLDGKRIFVHHEEGFGDSLMLIRFIKQLRGDVTVGCPSALRRLFEANFDVKFANIEETPNKDDFDYHTPMLSMIRYLGVRPDNIHASPYLKWEHVGKNIPGKFKVGIVWTSGDHGEELRLRRRQVPLELFLEIAEKPKVQLVSLQVGADADIPTLGAEGLIFDPSAALKDFAHTAEIINALDLVVAVDTSVAHLAGAMGKPVIMLGPYTRCWRWWSDTNGSPWYNDFKIIKQSQDGSWGAAMKRTVREVEKRFSLT